MEKIEYSDLNKFLVSLGVTLIALSILILWLFFREPFDLLVEQKNIDNLTDTAQAIIYARQDQVSLLIRIVPGISISLSLSGLISLIIGLCRWLKKQKLLDERDVMTNKKLKQELKKLSETEVAHKAETEYMQTIKEQAEQIQKIVDPNEKQQFIRSYLEVEQLISSKLITQFSNTYDVLVNHKLNQFEYDVILRPRNDDNLDKIIEIKYSPNELTLQYIRETMIRFGIATQFYKETMHKLVKPILIVVIPKVKYDINSLTILKDAFIHVHSLKVENFSLQFISQDELNNLTKERLEKIIS